MAPCLWFLYFSRRRSVVGRARGEASTPVSSEYSYAFDRPEELLQPREPLPKGCETVRLWQTSHSMLVCGSATSSAC